MTDLMYGVFWASDGDYLVAAYDTEDEALEHVRRVDEEWTPSEISEEDGPYYYIDTIDRAEVDFGLLEHSFVQRVG